MPLTVTTDDKNVIVEVTGNPSGTDYDPATGAVTGTPTLDDWDAEEETRDYTVTVEVKDKDGNIIGTDTAVFTV